MAELESIPAKEAERIENVVTLTLKQLQQRYGQGKPVRRGVHPKDHGCVTATFTVLKSLPKELQVGLFSKPGQKFDAFIRFSNADVNPEKADSALEGTTPVHGSRGIAVKVLGVIGTPLVTANLITTHGPLTQDFLMINQPVFAFANVEDYEALSEVLLRDKDAPRGFFARLASPDAEVRARADATQKIIGRIMSHACPPSFQPTPNSPLDNRYFGAAPFLFGDGRVMKFSAKPVSPASSEVADFSQPNYLRAGLQARLKTARRREFEFEFQVQVRSADSLAGKLETDIENVCNEWPEKEFPFVTVAKISIPTGQDIDSEERKNLCEALIFSPWNGLADHRPLGGINRLRRTVYEASSKTRGPFGQCPAGLDQIGQDRDGRDSDRHRERGR